ncbi:hypothetical protein PORY_001418 [Pneumocystis oryctolagi]|uniref:Uncharacterized protein n=1 Tax=Pneumocystis oryctolagi TaxID=42067 RepID=A0ACB7CCE0_9ASCO|nr:hypothetical protein PORY_001418 [Pneumocystis oryctolagi]
MGGITVRDVDADTFIRHYAKFLKQSGKLKVPSWVDIVKTGHTKEMAPYDPDWYVLLFKGIVREIKPAIARHIYLRKHTGVGALSKLYGGSKNRGSRWVEKLYTMNKNLHFSRPSHHYDGSRSIQRKALQSLEALGVLEKDARGGRRITQQGQRDLDHIALSTIESQA